MAVYSSAKADTFTLSFGDTKVQVPRHDLPVRFTEGMRELFARPWGPRVPYCLQLFIEGFGGTLSLTTDKRDAEFLAKASGIPLGAIPEALGFYDRIFEAPNGWFFETKGELRQLKMVPAFMHGTGAFLRKVLFDLKEYSDSWPSMAWLLSKWHNSAYAILAPVLEVPAEPKATTP